MTDDEFNTFLQSINGLVNGFYPDRDLIMSRYYFEIGNGWLGLVKELIEELIKLDWDKQLCQCKEKFGGLRFYINSATDEVHELISKAEEDSYKICDECGDEGELNTSGWMSTRCMKHK